MPVKSDTKQAPHTYSQLHGKYVPYVISAQQRAEIGGNNLIIILYGKVADGGNFLENTNIILQTENKINILTNRFLFYGQAVKYGKKSFYLLFA